MTDRTICLTVALEKEMRVDDVEVIENAIKAIRGVLDIEHITFDSHTSMNKWAMGQQIKIDFFKKIQKAFEENE